MLETNITGRLISTTPRSGTWSLAFFFQVLDALCTGKNTISIPFRDFTALNGLGFNLAVYHISCPGFLSLAPPQAVATWAQLQYPHPVLGFDAALNIVDANSDLFYPNMNDGARILYVYRNPLDQAVSIYFHGLEHRSTQVADLMKAMKSPNRYAMKGGFDAYLKQFYTFYIMKPMFPDQIMMVPYESLVRERVKTLREIVSFFAPSITDERLQQCIEKAHEATTMQRLKYLENMLGHSLGNDQMSSKGPTHIRGGSIGKWKDWFSSSEVGSLQKKLNDYGIGFDKFIFE